MKLSALMGALLSTAACGYADEFVRADDIDCWRGHRVMPNDKRFIAAVGLLSKEMCNEACVKRDGCSVVYQYEYEDTIAAGSCYLMRIEGCEDGSPDRVGDLEGWRTRVRTPVRLPTTDQGWSTVSA